MDDFKFKQMNASAVMFRNTLGGTPGGGGDDMYNDRIDNINIGEQNLSEVGKDEAGNPIMGNPLNTIVESTPPSKSETQGPLSNAVDFLNRVGESMFLDENGKTKSATNIAENVVDSSVLGTVVNQVSEMGNYLYNFANATPEQQKTMALPNLAKAGLRERIHKLPNATEIEHSQLFENFYYGVNSAQHNAEVKRIAETIGVSEEIFANDPELYKNAALMAERIDRMKKSQKYQDPDGTINMQKIYDDIPGLRKVQKEKGTAAAALVLANLEGMQTIGNIYKDDAAGQFFGSLGAGLNKEIGSIRKIWNWMGPTYGARMPNAEERAALADIDTKMKAVPKYSYNTTAGTVGAMLGGFLENAHYMASSFVPRAAVALATRGKGGAVAQKAGDVLSVATMAAITAPLQYEELLNSVDENGKPKYTPEQARATAIAQAIPQAVLEDYSLRQIGGAIFGKSAAPALRDIITRSTGLEAMKAGVADYIKFKVRDSVKAGVISYGSEFAEEFEQGVSDRVVENLAQIFINGKDADVQSIEEILYGATGDTIEAWNAIAGFGVAGLLLNPIANTRAVLNFRNNVRLATTSKAVQDRMANAHYNSVLSGVWENKGKISELHDKAPDVEATLLDAHNKEAGMEYGFVDVKALSQQEGGRELVEEIAQRNNYSADELAACIDGSGMLQVKTSTLMQMDIKDEQHQAIKQNVTTSLDAVTETQYNAALDQARQSMKDIVDFKDKTYKKSIDSILAARFPDSDQAALAREIMEANFDNPQEEYSRRLNSVNAEINEEVAPIVAELKKQKVKPKEGQTLTDLAIDIASGKETGYVIPDYQTDEMTAEKVGSLAEQRKALLGIRDRMRELNASEMVATATLDSSALKVYDTLISQMGKSNNKKVQKAAKLNALMFARFAQNMAKVISRVKQKPYTAEDFLRERLKVDVNAKYNKELADAAQLFQVSPAEFERQKTEVRKQYESTDRWMKAPNGKPTNLTEDQWVTVRTPAFKKWFGNWENDPANASKVVDANGEPLVVYHGTKKKFDTFEKQKIGTGVSKKTKGGNHFGSGFYFTPTYFDAQKFGRNVLEVFLNIKNPASSEYGLKEDSDGIIASGFNGREYIAFEPNQIKDATGRNVGFDPERNNIFLQSADTAMRIGDNIPGWRKASNVKEIKQILLPILQTETIIENKNKKYKASLSHKKLKSIMSIDQINRISRLAGIEKELVCEIIANIDLLYKQADLVKNERNQGNKSSILNEKVFEVEYPDLVIKIYTRETKNLKDKDTIYSLKIKNKKSVLQSSTTSGLDTSLLGSSNASINNISDITQNSKSKLSIEDIKESYIIKYVSGPIGVLKDVNQVAFNRYEVIDEICSILKELGAKQVGKLSRSHSAYYKIDNIKVRIADHPSNQKENKQDWNAELIFDDKNIVERLGKLKTRSDLKQYIYQSIMEQTAPWKNYNFNPLMQHQQSTVKGSIGETMDGQRLIRLFETADQSTFMHEMAHMFLLELQDIAALDPESREAKDLATIVKWAEYKPGQSEEYKGTASEAEFRQREEAIKAAEKRGDTAEADRLKGKWLQERFARGFEEYLRSGEAPATGLQKAFRQFKKWLQEIYTNVTGAGVRATPEVEAIMARIIASEEEIDALDAANSIARKVVDAVPENAAQVLQDMREEAKERAKEKLIRELIQAFEKNNLQGLKMKLDEIREAVQKELQNAPCFVCEGMISNGTPVESAIQFTGFATEQEYREALKAAGGSLKNAVNDAVKAARENILKQMPQGQQLYDMAEEAFNSGDYNARLSDLEAEIFNSMREEYNSLPAKLRRVFTAIDKGFDAELSKETWETFKKSIRNLKYAERWSAQEYVLIKEFEDVAGKLEEPDREAVEKLRKKYEEIKEQTIRNKKWINGIADATKGRMQAIKTAAEIRLGEEPITASTNPRYWHRQAIAAAKRAWDGLKKVKAGEKVDYNNAVMAKQEQALYDAMTAQAIKNKQKLDKMLNGKFGFLARGKRMADPKVKADPTLRYYHNHMLYIFGLRQSDAVPPAELKDITKVLAELRASHQFEDEVPAWLITAAAAKEPGKYYQQLTMGQLEELKQLTDIFYTLARNQNSLLTMDVDMETVQTDCTVDYLNNVDYQVGRQRINEITGAIGSYMNSLLKSERFLALLGGEHGAHIRYIYRTLFTASENEEKMQEQEAEALRELYGKYYTRQELRAILNDNIPGLSIGADTKITKENLICMALNMGNETNRARLAMGLFNCQSETERLRRESELMQLLQENLTDQDWKFVQAMWDHIDSFANPVSRVLEKCLGVPLKRVKAQSFEVHLPDGKILKMAGGYYPIVKDSSKSTRQSEFEQMEEAKAVGGISVLGTGMGTTKDRADNLMLNQGPLKLTLDVAHRHIDAQIHLITMRMAVRDAYKVLNSPAVKSQIESTFGQDTMKSLNEWVLSCWAPPIRPINRAEQVAANLRSGSISAIMAYRVSTALLNLANIVYMTNELGPVNAINAVCKFYRHPKENREAIMAASVYMRNRAANMDRDLHAQEERILNRHEGLFGKAGNAIDKATGGSSEEIRYLIDKYSNRLIEETDMLFSLPLYHWQFVETYNAELAKGVSEEEARETANYEATRRVTKVFPSSRKVDSSEVQRSRSEFVKLLTPFFSFSNTLMNAVWSKYYEGKYNGRVPMTDEKGNVVRNENGDVVYTTAKKNFIRRYGRFVLAALMDYMVGAFFETWLRQLPDILAGGGGDDDDDDRIGIGILSVNKKKFFTNSLDSLTGGFYGINAIIDTERVYSALVEGKGVYGGGRGIGVLSGTAQRGIKAVEDIGKLLHGSEKIDMLDFMRDMVKASNAKTGFSDTLTDALFNTVRFATDEGYSLDNMDDLREYIAKSIFDRKLKKK